MTPATIARLKRCTIPGREGLFDIATYVRDCQLSGLTIEQAHQALTAAYEADSIWISVGYPLKPEDAEVLPKGAFGLNIVTARMRGAL